MYASSSRVRPTGYVRRVQLGSQAGVVLPIPHGQNKGRNLSLLRLGKAGDKFSGGEDLDALILAEIEQMVIA